MKTNKYTKYFAATALTSMLVGFLAGHAFVNTPTEEGNVFRMAASECQEEELVYRTCLQEIHDRQMSELKASLPKIDAFFPDLK